MFTLASTGHLAAASSGGGAGNYTFLIVIVALFGLFYFVMIRPQRNKQRQVQQMQRQIGPGQRVRTTAGMYATVKEVDGDDVILELSPGVEARFMRRAVMDVVSDDSGLDGAMADGDEDGEDAAEDTAAAMPEAADAGQAATSAAEDSQPAG